MVADRIREDAPLGADHRQEPQPHATEDVQRAPGDVLIHDFEVLIVDYVYLVSS